MSSTNGIINKIYKKLRALHKFIICTPNTEESRRRPHRTYEELQESLIILRESNKRLRRQLQEKQAEMEKSIQANESLKEELKQKQMVFEEDQCVFFEQLKSLKNEVNGRQVRIGKAEKQYLLLKNEYERKIIDYQKNEALFQENKYKMEEMKLNLRENLHKSYNKIITNIVKDKNVEIHNLEMGNSRLTEELQSLRPTLTHKEMEIKCLRLVVAEAKQKEEILNVSLQRLNLLRERYENLQEQLRRSSEFNEDLEKKVSNLRKIAEGDNQRRGLYRNNELQCSSKHNAENVTEIFETPNCDSFDSSRIKNLVSKIQSISYILEFHPPKTSKAVAPA